MPNFYQNLIERFDQQCWGLGIGDWGLGIGDWEEVVDKYSSSSHQPQ